MGENTMAERANSVYNLVELLVLDQEPFGYNSVITATKWFSHDVAAYTIGKLPELHIQKQYHE